MPPPLPSKKTSAQDPWIHRVTPPPIKKQIHRFVVVFFSLSQGTGGQSSNICPTKTSRLLGTYLRLNPPTEMDPETDGRMLDGQDRSERKSWVGENFVGVVFSSLGVVFDFFCEGHMMFYE